MFIEKYFDHAPRYIFGFCQFDTILMQVFQETMMQAARADQDARKAEGRSSDVKASE